eukprot:145961-Prymnesium_polylepis.1
MYLSFRSRAKPVGGSSFHVHSRGRLQRARDAERRARRHPKRSNFRRCAAAAAASALAGSALWRGLAQGPEMRAPNSKLA